MEYLSRIKFNTVSGSKAEIPGKSGLADQKSDIRLYFILISVYTVFSLLAFFKSFYFLQKRGWKFFDMYFGLFILDWITIVAFIFFIAWSTKKLLNKQVRWRTIVILHFILAFLVNAGIRFVFEIYGFVQAGRPL